MVWPFGKNKQITQDQVVSKEKAQLEFLRKVAYDQVNFFHLNGYQTYAKVASVYDGDTCSLIFFLNDKPVKFSCRLAGLDCAEKASTDHLEAEHAQRTADRFHELIRPNHDIVYAQFHKFDKYRRLLVTLKTTKDAEQTINETFLKEDLAYAYKGGARIPFRDWHYLNIGVEKIEQ